MSIVSTAGHRWEPRTLLRVLALCCPLTAGAADLPSGEPADPSLYREWIQQMKESERGPFARIRWFCDDGTVLPPRGSGCAGHGGGHQHGEWNERTRELREQGYLVANLLAGVDAAEFLAAEGAAGAFAQLLIERFLVSADDGWIFQRALFYRGAIQEEDEREGARALLIAMASRLEWIGPRFAALRAGARLLPHGEDSASAQRVRQVSASLADRDHGFMPMRAKIHGAPGADDAARVRAYAAGLAESRRKPYLALADEIDRVYRAAPLDQALRELASEFRAASWLQELLLFAANAYSRDGSAANRFGVTGALLADLRDALPRIYAASSRLQILDLSLRVEADHFRAATELRQAMESATRLQRVDYLRSAGRGAYGTGVINARLLGELDEALTAIGAQSIGLGPYLDELGYLGRVPGWGTQALRMHFYEAMEKWAGIEPLAMLFIQDQLRGSPLLFFSQVLDTLSRDASRLAGVEHRLFGETVGIGFTALNPGLASGILHVEPDLSRPGEFRSDGIYLLPETVPDLPPIAGILTEGEGNPLSHVQLLARNLGIPNVTVDASLRARLAAHDGERVVMAVSSSGLVELERWDQRWRAVFEDADTAQGVRIEPDLDKLDLAERRFVSLDDLRAADSGRIVGPKAAKLGELRAHYPQQVSRGIAIPFGLFRQEALEQPHPDGGTLFEWMARKYQELEFVPAGPERDRRTEAFRTVLYELVAQTRPGEAFREALRVALQETFGSENPPGLFIRSDTNVEDLAGFTGAGLNLTLPNVMGFENLLEGIARVWASPFSARAFAWRQSHMTRPEHVYTSILLLESVASEKSGVLVTQDIDDGNPEVISVAVNEGLGGAVDGQAAESLRIPLDRSHVRVLATATAPWRRVPDPAGGVQYLPTSGSNIVLQPAEVDQLISFARGLPEKFPPITDDEGKPAPADVEFGFVAGRLQLFQLRPFLESKRARGIAYLHEMEARLADAGELTVDMHGVPE